MDAIQFRYQLLREPVWYEVPLSLEDYFELEEGERYEFESPVRYATLHEYLDFPVSEIRFIYIRLQIGHNIREFKQTFWNNGCNLVIERVDSGTRPYRELITGTTMQNTHQIEETLRIVESDGRWIPVLHSLSIDEISGIPDGYSEELNDFRRLLRDSKEVG